MSLSKSVWLPPCHVESGGIEGYGIDVKTVKSTGPEGFDMPVAVCNRSECAAEAAIGMNDKDFDIGVGTAFCAEALAQTCKLRPQLVE